MIKGLARKNWGRIGALLTWIGIIIATVFGVVSLPSFDEAEKFFGITLALLLGMFVYFAVFFEVQTSSR